MPLILSIETSTKVCSVALHRDAELLGYSEIHVQKSHSHVLTVLISELCRNLGIEIQQLDAIALSGGPGSYTGLRIGSSTAKGICYGIDKPLIAIDTLLVIAEEVSRRLIEPAFLVPMLDARRMEVYCAVLESNLQVIEPTHPLVLDEASFSSYLEKRKCVFFGNGAEKASDLINSGNSSFLYGVYPSAKWMGALAERLYQESRFEDIAYFEPFYLKEFISTAKNSC